MSTAPRRLLRSLGFWSLFAFLVALYPVVSFLGRTTLARFARAALPVQLIALSTRSSLATIPAQIESGRGQLGFSDRVGEAASRRFPPTWRWGSRSKAS